MNISMQSCPKIGSRLQYEVNFPSRQSPSLHHMLTPCDSRHDTAMFTVANTCQLQLLHVCLCCLSNSHKQKVAKPRRRCHNTNTERRQIGCESGYMKFTDVTWVKVKSDVAS